MKNLIIISLIGLSLVACSKSEETSSGEALKIEAMQDKKGPENKVVQKAFAKNLLIGNWAQTSEKCNSSEAMSFKSNGEYDTSEITGNWSLKSNIINVKLPSEEESLGQAELNEIDLKILALDANTLKLRAADNEKITLIRCAIEPIEQEDEILAK